MDGYKFNERVIIVDLEATCEQDNREFPNEIIEIGAIDNYGKEFSLFVKPKVKPVLTDFCKELTSITQEDVDNADEFPEVYSKWKKYVIGDGTPVTIVSWGEYDKRQLIRDMIRNKLPKDSLLDNHVNLKYYYKDVIGKWPGGMAKALRKLNIPLEGTHHRGIDDARNILKIYEYLRELDYINESKK